MPKRSDRLVTRGSSGFAWQLIGVLAMTAALPAAIVTIARLWLRVV
jgi:hypothetical protein